MPSLDPRFVTLPPLQEQLWDKDLNIPLAAGIVTFYEDENRTVRKDVYQLSHLPGPTYTYVNMGSQLILSSIGTFVDNSGNNFIPYLFPFEGTPDSSDGTVQLYYITVYSAAPPIGLGIEQFTVPSWPNISGGGSIADTFTDTANQLSNPQFVEVLFDNPASFTLSVTGTGSVYTIAPGWDIITSGTGTVTLQQLPLDTIGIITKPPYSLKFTDWTGSITSAALSQTLDASPGLLANSYVNAYMLASTGDGAAHNFTMNYVTSNGHTTELASGTCASDGSYTPISTFLTFGSSVLLPDVNSDLAPTGNVKIQTVLPINADFQLTSFQFAGVAGASSDVEYIQEATPRQIDHLFHYYKPKLEFKPISSYLTGWDFPLNPAQNGSTIAASSAANSYTWDQTILFQSTVSRINIARAQNGAILLSAAGGASQAALIQYLPQRVVRNMLENRMSVTITGDTSVPSGLLGTVSLWYTTNASLPTIPLSLVTTLDSNGYPTVLASGWTEIPRNNALGNAEFTLKAELLSSGFSGWDLTMMNVSNTATFFAIVVGTSSIPDTLGLSFNSISVVPGDIPTIPAPQSFDEVVRECSHYYQKSFLTGTKPAQNVGLSTGEYNGLQNTASSTSSSIGPIVQFRVPMITTPVVTLYNPSASNAQIRNETNGNDYSSSLAAGISANGFYSSGTSNGTSDLGDFVCVHWVANAQLGTF